MTWNEGHTWTLELPLPAGTLQFKVLMEEQGGGVRWEEGGDRSVALPTTTQGAVPVGSVGIACHWGDTGATSVKGEPQETGAGGAALSRTRVQASRRHDY